VSSKSFCHLRKIFSTSIYKNCRVIFYWKRIVNISFCEKKIHLGSAETVSFACGKLIKFHNSTTGKSFRVFLIEAAFPAGNVKF
jgi:hypothetical protein